LSLFEAPPHPPAMYQCLKIPTCLLPSLLSVNLFEAKCLSGLCLCSCQPLL
jgi:hypothetical protein